MLIMTEYFKESFFDKNIYTVFGKLKQNNILPKLSNQGRRPEEVYFSWMRGFVISNYFLNALGLIKNGIDLNTQMNFIPHLYSTDEIKVHLAEETKFNIIDKIKIALQNLLAYLPAITGIVNIDGVRISFDEGWGLIRASNTTPVLVTRFEATTPEALEIYKNSLNKLIEEVKN